MFVRASMGFPAAGTSAGAGAVFRMSFCRMWSGMQAKHSIGNHEAPMPNWVTYRLP
jgi:hypothetical protein